MTDTAPYVVLKSFIGPKKKRFSTGQPFNPEGFDAAQIKHYLNQSMIGFVDADAEADKKAAEKAEAEKVAAEEAAKKQAEADKKAAKDQK